MLRHYYNNYFGSAFYKKKLLTTVQSVVDCVELQVFEHYLVQVSDFSNDRAEQKLINFLKAERYEHQRVNSEIIVIPRFGTITPWSSKATEILKHCGWDEVQSIERGMSYVIPDLDKLSESELNQLKNNLHDRMTQVCINTWDEAEALFIDTEPEALMTIDVLNLGQGALSQANIKLGLALSEPEIKYLIEYYKKINRNPTDAELMMFAQANSEHCRHKRFNASWTIDGKVENCSLFEMIKQTTKQSPDAVRSAYVDNAAVAEGTVGERLIMDPITQKYNYTKEAIHGVLKVETHNHPTAIAPFAGAATGAGGEIRDEAATGTRRAIKGGDGGFCRVAFTNT